ncbi:MAG: YpdA family putative bacillithiol disulfide reductase [Crocinitomicaceae bacterium]
MMHISVLIIGAGPIGLSCGIEAKKQGITYRIIDKGCLVNSIHNFPTDMTFFSSSEKLEIGDVPFTSLAVRPSKREALEYYRRVADHHQLNLGLYEAFEGFSELAETKSARFLVKTSKNELTCDYIVNATGFYDAANEMNIPGEKLPKVQHYFTSAHHLFQQKVAVVGASNSAVDVALEAFRKGAEVSLIIRGKELGKSVKYWVRPDLEARIKEGLIDVYFETQIKEIKEGAIVIESQGSSRELENDFVFAMTGYHPNFKLFDVLGINSDSKGIPIYDEETMLTTHDCVYIAGVACGGKNTREWFIENSRDHGHKIMKHIIEKNER